MTRNQLEYWANLEKRRANITDEYLTYLDYREKNRHNKADEEAKQYSNLTGRLNYEESVRHDKETEAISWFHEGENKRHNEESERVSWYDALERHRHNVEGENVSWFNAYEGHRHNVQTENIGWFEATEKQRHDIMEEVEKNRHQIQEEELTMTRMVNENQHWLRGDSASAVQAKSSTENADANQRKASVSESSEKRAWYERLYEGVQFLINPVASMSTGEQRMVLTELFGGG